MKEVTLGTDIQYCKGVGSVRAGEFRKMGVNNVHDLLQLYPRDYIFAVHRDISDLEHDDFAVVKGTVNHVNNNYNLDRTNVVLVDGTGCVECTWFNQPHMSRVMRKHAAVTMWGRVTYFKGKPQMVNPRYSFSLVGVPQGDGGGTPVYPATKKLTNNAIGNVIRQVLPYVDRSFMYAIDMRWDMGLRKRGFIRHNEAIRYIHQPPSKQALKLAKKRLVYEEFRSLAIRMHKKRMEATSYEPGVALNWGTEIHSRIKKALGINPTGHQNTVMAEIVEDMCRPGISKPMYRLLQGDVGCGKTMVAIYAALLVAINRKQTVIMCPTKILAQQHYEEILSLLDGSRFRVSLLTSGQNSTQNTMTTLSAANGNADIIVATTSVLSDKVEFNDLGLLIVDEEHRFGVKQKEKLVAKYRPHQLFMSATPIPKALTATAFGDLDVSTIKEMPGGRGRRDTAIVLPHNKAWMYDQINEMIEDGGQVYDVYPRIEGEGGLEEAYGEGYFENAVMLHGKQTSALNAEGMNAFDVGVASVLMCTSMVEVGLHVENANVMIIHDAHMFGLTQLHQLRGRIGRGKQDAVCYLMCNTDNEDGIERLHFLESCDDGFEVAEKDLAIRGPGELLGAMQHGMPELKLADLIVNYKLLIMAKEDINDGTT